MLHVYRTTFISVIPAHLEFHTSRTQLQTAETLIVICSCAHRECASGESATPKNIESGMKSPFHKELKSAFPLSCFLPATHSHLMTNSHFLFSTLPLCM